MALEAVGIKSDLAMGHPGPSACHCSGDAVEKGELYHMGIIIASSFWCLCHAHWGASGGRLSRPMGLNM